MDRITEDQISRLVEFVDARVAEVESLQEEEACRAAAALRLIVHKQVGAVRYHRVASLEGALASEDLAIGSWNLLVAVAEVWRDHREFPADAAIETFEFDAEHPLLSAG